MADCMTKCISANAQKSGKIVTKVGVCNAAGLTTHVRDPKIQQQVDSTQFETQMTSRFDDPSYYYGTVTP